MEDKLIEIRGKKLYVEEFGEKDIDTSSGNYFWLYIFRQHEKVKFKGG